MQVGDKVYLKAVGNLARGRKEVLIREDVVSKIGRKYFEVGEGVRAIKFFIESKRQATQYSEDWELYFSKQESLDEEEHEKISWDIKSKFNAYGKVNLTIDQLRRIKEIINE